MTMQDLPNIPHWPAGVPRTLAPARTPPAIVERLNKAVRAVLTGDARAKLVDLGMEPALDDAKSLKQTISDDIRIHAELVRAAGLVPQ